MFSCEKAVGQTDSPIHFFPKTAPKASTPLSSLCQILHCVDVLWLRSPAASLRAAVLAARPQAVISKMKFPAFQSPLGDETLDERRDG